jgi:hypothetical protein
MKLYDVPRNTKIQLDGEEYNFVHIDGAYSYCIDSQGNIVHLAAWTEVEPVMKGTKNETENT